MDDSINADKVAQQLNNDLNEALNRKIEERFRSALFLVDPNLDMTAITIVSDVANDEQLTVDGVDDETIDKAMVIFEAEA